ncbi:hypothetical protein FKP32DRAFT_1671777 [Trametes sanguinea]|nr:hypothetical protein FKP32DRAFT_1671777 [Trametes sanguinea]
MSASQRSSLSPGGAAPSQGDFDPAKAGAQYNPPRPPPGLVNLPTSSGVSRPQPSSSSGSMIGQIPSLFDPNMANPPQSGLDYQQWVENYANGQYTYAQGGIPGNVSQVPFQQAPPQSQLHHVQTSVPPAPPPQNRYNFVQEQQFTGGDQGTSFDNHFVRPAANDRPQRGMPRISRQGGATVGYPTAPNLRIPEPPRGQYQQQPQLSPHHQQQAFAAAQASESYFYPSVSTDAISASGDQSHHHSSYNFVQQYQPEPYSATSYTPNSDFTNLPSSVSTPSVGGTDDSQHAFSSASSHLSAQAASQQPQASSSRQPSGAAARGRNRGGKQSQKRQRTDEPQDGGESDTQSEDDQPLSGMTMSVPPQQGQGSLPARL